jgi:hypothetical protein
MKKVVVSAIFGGHDYVKDPVLDGYNPEWEYHLFTDDPRIISDYWNVHLIAGDRQTAREIKIMTWKYIPYDVRLWVDGSMVLKGNPDDILKLMGDADLYLKLHPERETQYQEIQACIKFGKFTKADADALTEHYKALGYTKQIQDSTLIYETGLNMARNTSAMIEFMNAWYNETLLTNLRDQISLPYIIHKLRPKMAAFSAEYNKWAELSAHGANFDLPHVYYFQPFAVNGNLGAAYNDCEFGLDDEDYLCILDQDVCFLDSRQKKWIAETIERNKEYDVFTCMTNRLSNGPQIVNIMYDQPNIGKHKQRTLLQWKTYGTSVMTPEQPTAGLFMLMKARVLRAVLFKNGLMYLDTDFYVRATEMGFKFGIMRGIYLYHYYRLVESRTNINHLKRIGF